MGRLEVACRRFAVLSGIRQEPGIYTSCVLPRGAAGQRKGLLALATEPAGEHPALASGACKLAQEVVTQHFYANDYISLTSGLLRALDAANDALLEQNYSEDIRQAAGASTAASLNVAVRSGGIRSKGAHVGLTAVLLRPDGAGVYLAQMAPTQAYVVHDGMLAALPEPRSWHRGGKVAVMLRRVPNPNEAGEEEDESDGLTEALRPTSLPSLPLGSGTGVDVDLVFRRVEAGDVIVVVSRSLARHLDKPLTEEILSSGDADYIIDALYNLSTEKGLAESHACVLQLGAETTSGVDMELPALFPAPYSEANSESGSDFGEPEQGGGPQTDTLGNILKGPREWFSRRKAAGTHAAEEEDQSQSQGGEVISLFGPSLEDSEEAAPVEMSAAPTVSQDEYELEDGEGGGPPAGNMADTPPFISNLQPTQALLQHSLELPPYKVQHEVIPPPQPGEQELEFDGWEDSPPVLSGRQRGSNGEPGMPLPPWLNGNDQTAPAEEIALHAAYAQPGAAAPRHIPTGNGLFAAPRLFDDAEEDGDMFALPGSQLPLRVEALEPAQEPSAAPRVSPASDYLQKATQMLTQAGGKLRALAASSRGGLGVGGARGMVVPYRLIIAAGLVLLVGLLAFSVLRGSGNAGKNEAARLLQKTKQDETLGNQPTGTREERLSHLQTALGTAQQALLADPASKEASVLVTQVQLEIDTLQGIARVDTSLLFDLTNPGAAGQADPAAANPAAAAPVSATGQLASIVIQGNEAYILDRERGKVFRCHISSRDCAAVLQSGDSAGGKKVGPLLAMTARVGNLAVMDTSMVSYIYSADTSAWQALQLGGAEGLARPRDFGSFDGNLYLLLAKPGQISKYASGHYGEGPEDWVKDGASSDQVKDAVALAIDGAIYTLLPDGKIVVMQGGKTTRTIVPKLPDGMAAPTGLFTNPDIQGLYLLFGQGGAVVRMNKEGQVISTLKPADTSITSITGMAVDEGRGKMYLLNGRKVYEAGLTARRVPVPAQTRPAGTPQTDQSNNLPSARPTAEP